MGTIGGGIMGRELLRGALVTVRRPYASHSPETMITEVAPGATVTLTQSLGCGEATRLVDLGRDRGQDQVLARE